MNATSATKKLTDDILVAISEKYFPHAMVWRQNVFAGKIKGRPGTKDRFVRSCPKGTADIIGCIFGWAVAIEVKFGNDDLSTDQENWHDAWIRGGGIHVIARGVRAGEMGIWRRGAGVNRELTWESKHRSSGAITLSIRGMAAPKSLRRATTATRKHFPGALATAKPAASSPSGERRCGSADSLVPGTGMSR